MATDALDAENGCFPARAKGVEEEKTNMALF